MQCGKSIVEYTLYIQEPYTYVYMKDLIKEDQISLIERSNGRKQRENIPKRINNEKGKYKTHKRKKKMTSENRKNWKKIRDKSIRKQDQGNTDKGKRRK